MKLDAKSLRDASEDDLKPKLVSLKKNPIYFILEDVYDTYNIGGQFRLADALAVKTLYLCGGTATPPNIRIAKASVGTYKVVPWVYKKTAKEAIQELRKKEPKIQIIAVEQDKKAVDYRTIEFSFPIALVMGHETTGVREETLKLVDQIAEIPMWGVNKSLNVIVSAAIVSYFAVRSAEH